MAFTHLNRPETGIRQNESHDRINGMVKIRKRKKERKEKKERKKRT